MKWARGRIAIQSCRLTTRGSGHRTVVAILVSRHQSLSLGLVRFDASEMQGSGEVSPLPISLGCEDYLTAARNAVDSFCSFSDIFITSALFRSIAFPSLDMAPTNVPSAK